MGGLPAFYIALLKRVQSVAVETKARQAQADARVNLAQENQRQKVGVGQETARSKARVSAILAGIEAEKQKIEAVRNRLRAAWLIDNFDRVFEPFAATLGNHPAGHVTVVTGSGGNH
ncbi:MAG: hypothetical protein NT080_02470 [Spirochaetes bacterium]|nr:hypothetical protein [Spirochaetota bacterium]